MNTMIPGPSYREMLRPVYHATPSGELDPFNLFRITWRGANQQVRHIAVPKGLTGVRANIIVLEGGGFPSGSHKVGPAYATLMEGELTGEIEPGASTIIGPSTGNFGIGVAYVARLKGYPAVVIMPDGMSRERYERIRHYGGRLDLTPGSESDVILVLERTEEYKKDSRNKVLAQFELLPNYRFHRYVTGRSALEAAQQHGNGRMAAFVSAPGSAGTLAAGDEIKARFPDAVVCALEPKECSTLFNNGRGTHRIEGIGDKMVPLIHNVLTTDYVQLIHDDDCVKGLELVQQQLPLLERLVGLAPGKLGDLRDVFGISGICNLLGAIRLARYLDLGSDDNVVTIATDGFDRYGSVLADLEKRVGPLDERMRTGWFESLFRCPGAEILDVRPPEEKERLFAYKEQVWTGFGYSRPYLERMKSQSFWDSEYERIEAIDGELANELSTALAART
jgi:cysteine synthase A